MVVCAMDAPVSDVPVKTVTVVAVLLVVVVNELAEVDRVLTARLDSVITPGVLGTVLLLVSV